ncbi:MAG: hypothetical protein ACTSYI_11945, partial [Promethearchaeota archaeon]
MAISSVTEVLSDQLFQRPLNIFEEFRHEYFLFSVFPYYSLPKHSKKKRSELRTHGIRPITNVAGKILLDSGGFQLYRRDIHLNCQETIKIYQDCRLSPDDHAISLDYCPFFLDPPAVRHDKISRSISNYQEMKKVFPQTIPVIHGTNRAEMKRSLDAMGSGNFLAYPSNFPLIPTQSSLYTKQGVSLKTLLIQRMVIFLSL